MSNSELLLRVLVELALILVACRAVGAAFRRIGQPQVMGEMVAGVILGPSVFGVLAPELQSLAFPHATEPVLFVLSQVGLALYMFSQGLEFDVKLVSARSATAVSLAGIVGPLAIGGALGFLMARPGAGFFAAGIPGWEAALFLGAAMSITAFPVLARIVEERGIKGTRLGSLSLAAGSLNDAFAWLLLAVVLATVRGSVYGALLTLVGSAVFIGVLMTAGRRWLAAVAKKAELLGAGGGAQIPTILTVLVICACFTDYVGLHLVFGSFMLGAVIPKGVLNERLRSAVGPVSTALLVPLFFAYSGLNTRFALIDSASLWGIALVVLAAASVAKAVACGAAARYSGLSVRESAGVGALMNARGLMELILLNIGLEAGIITPTLFAIMALMAVATTFAATPAFELTRRGLGEALPDRRPA